MIAPQASAAFVAAMEKVLDIYSRPYDAKNPVVCMDETPRQLIRETREPIAAAPGRPERHDYPLCQTRCRFRFSADYPHRNDISCTENLIQITPPTSKSRPYSKRGIAASVQF